jgi:Nucleoside-diphosphate-sugar epimerases
VRHPRAAETTGQDHDAGAFVHHAISVPCDGPDNDAYMPPTDLVTGAFGFTGSRIAERLLGAGRTVRTLSRRSGEGNPLAGRIERAPYDFGDDALARSLASVDTVYATYWMRFPRGGQTWPEMVANVGRLCRAARAAGVRRFVYVSVTNARPDSSTAYFRAKAAAEAELRGAVGGGLSLAIVRPTLLYGPADILINNMAWTLRRLPVFGIPGDGRYRVQPVLVDDVADLAVRLGGAEDAADVDAADVDAAGPETFTFDELVATVRAAVGSRSLLMHMPVPLVQLGTRVVGVAVRDVVLTRDELRELMESLLVGRDPAGTCPTRFSDWLAANKDSVGRSYSSELARNFRLKP